MSIGQFCVVDAAGGLHNFQWVVRGDPEFRWRNVKNGNGTTGDARVVQSESRVGVHRLHLCANQPCTANWEVSRYGLYGPPEHVRLWQLGAGQPAEGAPSAAVAADVPAAIADGPPAAIAAGAPAAVPVDAFVAAVADAPPAIEADASDTAAAHTTTAVALEPFATGAANAPAMPAADASAAEAPQDAPPCPGSPSSCSSSSSSTHSSDATDEPEVQSGGEHILGSTETAATVTDLPKVEIDTSASEALPVPAMPHTAAIIIPAAAPPAALPNWADPLVAMAPDAPLHSKHFRDAVLFKVLRLARDIRSEHAFVGYIFFVILAIMKDVRPFAWEGTTRVDIINVFAPWALAGGTRCTTLCTADAVACCLTADDDGPCVMHPVSVEHPLAECRHWLAGHYPVTLGGGAPGSTDIVALYHTCHVLLLGTVADGNCGPDTACIMLGIPQSRQSRKALRDEVADYICDRCQEDWMHDLLVVTQELSADLLNDARQEAHDSPAAAIIPEPLVPGSEPGEASAPASTVAEATEPQGCVTHDALAAIQWSTNLTDLSVVRAVCSQLPEWAIQQQLALFRNKAEAPSAIAVKDAEIKLLVRPKYECDRRKACEALHQWLQDKGLAATEDRRGNVGSLPWGAVTRFVRERIAWPHTHANKDGHRCRMRQWYSRWRKDRAVGGRSAVADQPVGPPSVTKTMYRKHSGERKIENRRRQRGRGAGRHFAAIIVRQGLFDWFCMMRYNVDWKALRSSSLSFGVSAMHKAICRFSRGLLRTKCKQLIGEYVRVNIEQGLTCQVFEPNSHWFDRFFDDYGLCERAPNRQYKVPKEVLYQRLEIGWLNQARIRQLCICVFGYDPGMENWDQSPFHPNEGGAQKARTVAIMGSPVVPILENPNVTHSRWTLNATTFSEKERILAGERPYMQLMFKFDGEVVKGRLQEYIRSRGYPSWLSATTSDSGSYREHHVMEYLDKHLPLMSTSRRWRINMADDYGPHKSAAVFNINWNRGYVMLPHGGGVTPVAQTPDTDLNQHIRRQYTEAEGVELIHQLRMGIKVPSLTPERSIDIMHDILAPAQIHLDAAEGYIKTGERMGLENGELDYLIVREAGVAWNDLGMRAKVNAAVAQVKHEHAAGRLKWCVRDVKGLIVPFPAKSCDKVLAAQGEMHGCMAEDVDPEDTFENPAVESADESAVESADESAHGESRGSGGDTSDDVDQPSRSRGSGTVLSQPNQQPQAIVSLQDATAAAAMLSSSRAMTVYKQVVTSLEEAGLITAAVHMQNIVKQQQRKDRMLQKESPEVADAFAKQRELEYMAELKQKQLMDAATATQKALSTTRRKTDEANQLLKKRKAELLNTDRLLEAAHAVKNVSLACMGDAKPRGGGAKAKKVRHQVLDRFASLGTGLSAAQRNDFAWFKDAWDTAMVLEHDATWGRVFAQWMQAVVQDIQDGRLNAFSLFMHNETRRCLSEVPVLSIPAP